MELNEIKKMLYRNNVPAKLTRIRKNVAYYEIPDKTVTFAVPINDMGDTDFLPDMDAKLLIRYIVKGD